MADAMFESTEIISKCSSKGKSKVDDVSSESSTSEDEKPCGLFSLPTEIIQHLLTFLPSSHSALQVALCSKTCYAMALPALYSHIDWSISLTPAGDASQRGHDFFISNPYLHRSVRSIRLSEKQYPKDSDNGFNNPSRIDEQPRQPQMITGIGLFQLPRRLFAPPAAPRITKDPQYGQLASISSRMMKSISLCRNLQELTLRTVTLPKDFYEIVHSLRNLTTVTVRACKLSGPYPKDLNPENLRITTLTLLQLQHPTQRISPRKLKAILRLARSPRLQSLTIDRSLEIALDSLTSYGIPSTLTELTCDFRGFTPRGRKALQAIWNFFNKCDNVEILSIVDISGVKSLQNSNQLNHLNGNGTNANGGIFSVIPLTVAGGVPNAALNAHHNNGGQADQEPFLVSTITSSLTQKALPNLKTLVCPLDYIGLFSSGRPVEHIRIVTPSPSFSSSYRFENNPQLIRDALMRDANHFANTRGAVTENFEDLMDLSVRLQNLDLNSPNSSSSSLLSDSSSSESSNASSSRQASSSRSKTRPSAVLPSQCVRKKAEEVPRAQFLPVNIYEISENLRYLPMIIGTGLQCLELNIKEWDKELIYAISGLLKDTLKDLRVVWFDGDLKKSDGEDKIIPGDDFYMTIGNIIEFPHLERLHLYNTAHVMGHLIGNVSTDEVDLSTPPSTTSTVFLPPWTYVDHTEYMLIWQRYMLNLQEVALCSDVVWRKGKDKWEPQAVDRMVGAKGLVC